MAAVALTVAGIAGAAWLTEGHGAGRAHAGNMSQLVITPTDEGVDGKLVPNSDGWLNFTVANPNEFPVTLTDIALDGPITLTGGGDATGAALTLNQAALNAQVVGVTIDPLDPGKMFQVPDGVHMGDAANAFQDASFDVPLILHASS